MNDIRTRDGDPSTMDGLYAPVASLAVASHRRGRQGRARLGRAWHGEAGEAWRREQAASMIRSVRIEYADTPEPRSVRGWVARKETGGGVGYRPVEEVVHDDIAMEVLRRECERAISELKRKYGHLAEFSDLMKRAAS